MSGLISVALLASPKRRTADYSAKAGVLATRSFSFTVLSVLTDKVQCVAQVLKEGLFSSTGLSAASSNVSSPSPFEIGVAPFSNLGPHSWDTIGRFPTEFAALSAAVRRIIWFGLLTAVI